MTAGRVDLESKMGCSLVQYVKLEMPIRHTNSCPPAYLTFPSSLGIDLVLARHVHRLRIFWDFLAVAWMW